MQSKLTNEEVKSLIYDKGLTLQQMIDVVVEVNGIIGVGLVSLGQALNEYCQGKIPPYDAYKD